MFPCTDQLCRACLNFAVSKTEMTKAKEKNLLVFLPAILQFFTCVSAEILTPCPSGLPLSIAFRLPTTMSCYFLTLAPMSLYEAKAVCEGQNGGHLLFYETQAEQEAMESEIINHWNFLTVKYWLGLSVTGNTWYWTIWKDNLKIPVTFTDWVTSPVSNYPFVTMMSGGGWASTSEYSRHAVICEIDETPLVDGHAQQMQGAECPFGLPLLDHFVLPSTQSCYFSEDKDYSISQARGICESQRSGHLVFLESQEEMTELNAKLYQLYPLIPDEYWLGMEKIDGVWKWVNTREGTQQPVTWTSWLVAPTTDKTFAGSMPLMSAWGGQTSSGSLTVVCEIDNQIVPVPPATDKPRSPGKTGLYRLHTGDYDVRFEVRMRSVIECAAQCSRDINCKGLHYRTTQIPECLLLADYSGAVPGQGFDCNSQVCYVL